MQFRTPYTSSSKNDASLGLWRLALISVMLAGCDACSFGAIFGDGENTRFHELVRPGADAGAAMGADASAPSPPKEPRLCVFDYDLTLSSHNCGETEGSPDYFCRESTCDTYGWYSQCLAIGARAAIAECVRHHAYIGIASKADVDYCWADKVLPIISQDQFPELTNPPADPDATAPIVYPAIDDRANWNCDNCAYTMDGVLGKPEGIRRVMRYYGLDPNLPEERARVIFWDDMSDNVADVKAQMPEVRAVHVPNFTGIGADGGCGITQADIDTGWAP
jgi:hypothetical protein